MPPNDRRTPGPLHFEAREDIDRPNRPIDSIVCESGEVVAEVYGTDHGDASGPKECRANADRLIACFNAMECLNPDGVAAMVEALKEIHDWASSRSISLEGMGFDSNLAAAALKEAGVTQ